MTQTRWSPCQCHRHQTWCKTEPTAFILGFESRRGKRTFTAGSSQRLLKFAIKFTTQIVKWAPECSSDNTLCLPNIEVPQSSHVRRAFETHHTTENLRCPSEALPILIPNYLTGFVPVRSSMLIRMNKHSERNYK